MATLTLNRLLTRHVAATTTLAGRGAFATARVTCVASASLIPRRRCYVRPSDPRYNTNNNTNNDNKSSGSGWTLPRIPVGVGLALIAGIQLKHLADDTHRRAKSGRDIPEGTPGVDVDGSWLAHILRYLPLRTLSRAWGVFNNELTVPVVLRAPLYSLYAWVFDCPLHEMVEPDLSKYRNLGEFFYRSIRLDECRPVDSHAALVSPADGLLLHYGTVDRTKDNDAIVHGIKGTGYNVHTLLGGLAPSTADPAVDAPLARSAGTGPTDMHFAVIYLAPGDYHRYHSPAAWTVSERRHVHGELLSVSPRLLRHLPSLFTLNERVALLGSWTPNSTTAPLFFAMVPVGATNVGSIVINFDPELDTNHPAWHKDNGYGVESLKYSGSGVSLTKGQEVGGFKLGSTVVLVWETPAGSFKWAGQTAPGESVTGPLKVKVGEPLGHVVV
ncbi:phosphatidylserine decarboxylase-domain-containing protein [Blastocladiella britannica]|nr:phosphatidylserine decarboxylase-domain-containing protein [Blastocladiella britannica]